MRRNWRQFFCLGLALGPAWAGVHAGWKVSPPVTYYGMCDASGGAAMGTNLFAVADDEQNQLRIYHAEAGGPPVLVQDLTAFLNVTDKFPETDLEGATWLGDKIFWIGSHGRNREGKRRPNRDCFFATTVEKTAQGLRLVPVGLCYKNLLSDLTHDRGLKIFKLAAASKRAPKTQGALNIEGLCAAGQNRLLIGFRNPIPFGRALLVPLLNPNDVIAGRPARFGAPILLDLGGLGIRDLGSWQGKILILAGAYDTEKTFRLYVWSGGAEPPQAIPDLDCRGLTPEALVIYPHTNAFQILSDDGTLEIQKMECKHLPDQSQRRFRAVWITP
jgi:hypothetical protein